MLPIERTLNRIQEFDPAGERALSLYLVTDPARDAGRNVPAQLDGLIRPLYAELDVREQKELEAEVVWVRERLGALRPPPRSTALFSCRARDFLETVALADALVAEAAWDTRLHLRPLLAAVDEHERTLAVLVDKESGRFFLSFLGDTEELPGVSDWIPGKHAQGGDSQGKFARDHEKHVHWHARVVVDRLLALVGEGPSDRILLGGTPEAIAEVRGLLPRRLRDRVKEELHLPLYATEAEAAEGIVEAARTVERRQEVELLERVVERVGAGFGVLGPAEVTEAVGEDRVAVLLFSETTRPSGARCEACGRVLVEPVPAHCPSCGGALRPAGDAVELLCREVLDRGGRVEELRGEAAERLQESGGLGALLRYRAAAAASGPVPG